MYCYRKVKEDLYWVGGNDRRLSLFEGVYSVPDGVSYNSYLLLDEKTVLFDTVSIVRYRRPFHYRTVFRKSGICTGWKKFGLHDCKPYGAGSLRVAAGACDAVSGCENPLQHKNCGDDKAIFRFRHRFPRAACRRGRHVLLGTAQFHVRHGADGALAGGHGRL
mgnify:CR=1 FL=1